MARGLEGRDARRKEAGRTGGGGGACGEDGTFGGAGQDGGCVVGVALRGGVGLAPGLGEQRNGGGGCAASLLLLY